MFDGGAQLADVARPIVSQERVHRFGRKIDNFLVIRFGKVPQKRAHQQGNIVFAVAQRRHHDPHDVETEI